MKLLPVIALVMACVAAACSQEWEGEGDADTDEQQEVAAEPDGEDISSDPIEEEEGCAQPRPAA